MRDNNQQSETTKLKTEVSKITEHEMLMRLKQLTNIQDNSSTQTLIINSVNTEFSSVILASTIVTPRLTRT